MKTGDLFPLAQNFIVIDHKVQYTLNLNVMFTGEFRQPKAGEWFLSGAIVEGYKAERDLKAKYHIGKLVRIERVMTIDVKEVIE